MRCAANGPVRFAPTIQNGGTIGGPAAAIESLLRRRAVVQAEFYSRLNLIARSECRARRLILQARLAFLPKSQCNGHRINAELIPPGPLVADTVPPSSSIPATIDIVIRSCIYCGVGSLIVLSEVTREQH